MAMNLNLDRRCRPRTETITTIMKILTEIMLRYSARSLMWTPIWILDVPMAGTVVEMVAVVDEAEGTRTAVTAPAAQEPEEP